MMIYKDLPPKHLFNDERALIRIDMNELMEQHSAAKLSGALPGYVGHEEGSPFEYFRCKPYVLFLMNWKRHTEALPMFSCKFLTKASFITPKVVALIFVTQSLSWPPTWAPIS